MRKMGMLVLLLFLTVGVGAKQVKKAAKSSSSTGSKKTAHISDTYTVQSGDSLYTIAKRHHTSIQALCDANGIDKSTLLRPGQSLKIPSSSMKKKKKSPISAISAKRKSTASTPKRKESSYKVEAGDTLSLIAQRFGVKSEDLRAANGMKKSSLIRIGQILKIPSPKKKELSFGKKSSAKTSTEKKLAKKKAPVQEVKKKRAETKENSYTVQSGDTLFSIARKYHTSLKDLMSLNGISPTDIIKPGQELKIPSESYRVAKKGEKSTKVKVAKTPKKVVKKIEPVYYTVRHGDTLWKIAARHKVSIKEIRTLNKLSRRHILHTGEKLMIKAGSTETVMVAAKVQKEKPAAAKAVSKKVAKYYTVKHGDSLWKIAKEYKISLSELRAMNKMPKGKVIHSGMKLTVGYEEVPVKVAAKKKSVKKKGRVAQKKRKSRKVAKKQPKTKKGKRYANKSANRRISSAMAALNGKGGSHYSSGSGNAIIRTAKRYLGRRYVWGAEGPSTFDCSGFTQYVYRKSRGVKLPRVSRKQAYYGKYVTRSQLRPGDLIFFDTSHSRRGYVNHVGIYIGNNKFIHASSARHRVVITSLNRPFYRARFKWGRRVN